MNETANTIGILLVVVALVATVIRLIAARGPGAERLATAALVTVVVILVGLAAVFVSGGLRGWYGGPGE